jgi:trehalose-6-phosphate synthase
VEPSGGRLIVVANRLPVTCSKDAAGKWKLQISAGGLVSALMGVNNYSTLWIGWPGELGDSSSSSSRRPGCCFKDLVNWMASLAVGQAAALHTLLLRLND